MTVVPNIIINTENSYYKTITSGRGYVGLGVPYTVSDDPVKILVPRDTIVFKLDQIKNGLLPLFRDANEAGLRTLVGGQTPPDNITKELIVPTYYTIGGAIPATNNEDALLLNFKARLSNILFPPFYGGKVPAVAGQNYRSFFLYNTWNVPVIPNVSSLEATRRYIVQRCTSWVALLESILKGEEGISQYPPIPGTYLVNENSQFTLPQPSKVYYGAYGTYLTRQLNAGTYICSNEQFGEDPLPLYVKVCRSDPLGIPGGPIVEVQPTVFNTSTYGSVRINITTAQIPFTTALLSSSKDLINLKTTQFFDKEREYKTILNFGDDKHYVLEAWRPGPTTESIQVKLVNRLANNISLYSPSYIVREFSHPVIDTLNIELAEIDDSLSLRPANTNVKNFLANQQIIRNVTLNNLQIQTGSSGVIVGSTISYDDRVFSRWFTADFNSSELNIDFSDYNNFVFFGSATARLEAFKNKLRKIESYPVNISVSSSVERERKLAIEKESIKRNFDPYEQYLYFASMSNAYSASAYYVDGGVEYNITGSWPKTAGMVPLSYESVEQWYETQYAIAERFDEFNTNYLIKHLPEHIQEDEASADFIKFIQMFGHVMDNLKVYVDQFTNIYSTNPDPFKELTMDQVYEVGKSFGFDFPNAYSLESLQSFISSLYDGIGTRALLAETWKRFLHSSIYLKKLKGTRTGTDAVLNTFGMNSPLVQVKESTYAQDENYIKSDELVYALQFTGSISSSVRIPFVSSSYTASTIQLRFIPETKVLTTVLSSDVTYPWAVEIEPHPSASTYKLFNTQSVNYRLAAQVENQGRIRIVSGSNRTVIASSSYFPLFSDDYTNLMLRSQSQDLVIVQTDGDQILYEFSASVAWGNLWNTNKHVYLGTPTSSIVRGVFDGIIDDVRVWSVDITKNNYTKQAYDPGAYYGSNYSSSYNNLLVDISFSQPYTSITQSATNESPFFDVSNLSNLPATGFTTASYVRILRTIKQFSPIVGSSIFSNRKVIVAEPPVFRETFIDLNGVKTLQTKTSIKGIPEKTYVGGQDFVQFAVSPTDFVNQNILRSMGNVDTNYLIGSPRKISGEQYTELNTVFDFFLEKYNESININDYIRFFVNVLKAPTEYMQTYTPARTTLVDGVVIESPILHRQRTYLQKSIKVDGSNTRTLINFISGSGSKDVGAYTFVAELPGLIEDLNTNIITNPVLQKIGTSTVTSSMLGSYGGFVTLDGTIDTSIITQPQSSTEQDKLPTARQITQKIGKYFVSSSLLDNNSSVSFIDALITTSLNTSIVQTGYARNVYKGLQYPDSDIYRIPTEENTINPFYAIGPVADFSDVGATTYFYKSSGIYWFPDSRASYTQRHFNKREYRAKLNVPIGEITSTGIKELSRVVLLPTSSLADYPGRTQVTIQSRQYSANSTYKGILNIANVLSIYNIEGTAGLRLRLYRSAQDQNNDLTRSFTTLPSTSAGVLFDGLLGNPEIFPYTLMYTSDSTLYFTVDNTTGSSITSTIKITYFAYEPTNSAPTGYLSRHYRFNRTKNISLIRRNYLGCKQVFCPEGCPPDVKNADTVNPVTEEFEPKNESQVNPPGAGEGGVGRDILRGTADPITGILSYGSRGKLSDTKK